MKFGDTGLENEYASEVERCSITLALERTCFCWAYAQVEKWVFIEQELHHGDCGMRKFAQAMEPHLAEQLHRGHQLEKLHRDSQRSSHYHTCSVKELTVGVVGLTLHLPFLDGSKNLQTPWDDFLLS